LKINVKLKTTDEIKEIELKLTKYKNRGQNEEMGLKKRKEKLYGKNMFENAVMFKNAVQTVFLKKKFLLKFNMVCTFWIILIC
jgi:hypothetical protein